MCDCLRFNKEVHNCLSSQGCKLYLLLKLCIKNRMYASTTSIHLLVYDFEPQTIKLLDTDAAAYSRTILSPALHVQHNLPTGIGRSKDVLQSSHEHETTKLVEERNTLKRTLSSKQVKLRTMEEERKAYEKQVCAWKSY